MKRYQEWLDISSLHLTEGLVMEVHTINGAPKSGPQKRWAVGTLLILSLVIFWNLPTSAENQKNVEPSVEWVAASDALFESIGRICGNRLDNDKDTGLQLHMGGSEYRLLTYKQQEELVAGRGAEIVNELAKRKPTRLIDARTRQVILQVGHKLTYDELTPKLQEMERARQKAVDDMRRG